MVSEVEQKQSGPEREDGRNGRVDDWLGLGTPNFELGEAELLAHDSLDRLAEG